jgi:hypothetical protein
MIFGQVFGAYVARYALQSMRATKCTIISHKRGAIFSGQKELDQEYQDASSWPRA